MSYTLRNALHHGIAPIPYAYPHSSVNSIFRKEMGKTSDERLIPQKSYYKYIGRRAEYPSSYKMNKNGLFLRESVLDIAQVENMFVTPRSFDYYMGRKTNEDWLKEQNKDNLQNPPVRLEDIEAGAGMQTLESMMINENGKGNYRKISDSDLCIEIDDFILPEYGKDSVYLLSDGEKRNIAELLYKKYHINEMQIRRCLVYK
jgi:hypothetical protein